MINLQNQNQAVGIVVEAEVNDRELAFLTAYLMNDYRPQDLQQQEAVNAIFNTFGLDRFDMPKLQPMNQSIERIKFQLDESLAAFTLRTLNGPMPTRYARNIGAGSSFFSRVLSAKRVEQKKPSGDKPPDTEGEASTPDKTVAVEPEPESVEASAQS